MVSKASLLSLVGVMIAALPVVAQVTVPPTPDNPASQTAWGTLPAPPLLIFPQAYQMQRLGLVPVLPYTSTLSVCTHVVPAKTVTACSQQAGRNWTPNGEEINKYQLRYQPPLP